MTSLAFDLTFSFVGTFLVMMFLVVGVAVPTPGGVGGRFTAVYLVAVTTFLRRADADTAARRGASSCTLMSFVPVTIVGLVVHVAGWI